MVYWESQLTAVNDSLIVFDLTHLLVNTAACEV